VRRRQDADLRAEVLQALMRDELVPSTVDAWVEDGEVRLSGTVDWQYQRDEAEKAAASVPGLAGVAEDVLLTDTTGVADDVRDKIREAFTRQARIDAERLDVAAESGTVTLRGTVASRDEYDAAVAAAWSAPGIRAVEDGLTGPERSRR
jgi:osmotically-inducible protein OsmY